MKTVVPVLLAVLALTPAPALAAGDPVSLGKFGDWNAFSFDDSDTGGKACFMSSPPQKTQGLNGKKRGDNVLLFVTHWSGEGAKNVVSVSAGYTYKTDSQATVKADGKSFSLFTEGEMAWARNAETDNALTDAIRGGSNVSVTGTSARGTTTTDTYSLKGSADAYDAITKACQQ